MWIKGQHKIINTHNIRVIDIEENSLRGTFNVVADGHLLIKECFSEAEAMAVIKKIFNDIEIKENMGNKF